MVEVELYSLNAECDVLGGCLTNSSLISQARSLSEDDFYHAQHKIIFAAILYLDSQGKEPNPIAVDEHIGTDEGYFNYLIEMGKNYNPSRSIQTSIDITLDYSLRRNLQRSLMEKASELQNRKSIDVVNELQSDINHVAEKVSVGDVLGINDLINISADKMRASLENVRVGIGTGFDCIDERIGYKALAFGEVTALGALSKNGKTLFMNSIAANCDLRDDEVGHVFSIEMPLDAMFNSVVSAMTGVPADFYCRQHFYSTVYSKYYDEMHGKWANASMHLNTSNKLTFDGKKDVDADYLCSEMKKQASVARSRGKKLKLVFVDHFHRMNFHTGGGPMTYAMRDAVRKIKNTAADLGIAVVLLVQLNNVAEGKDPTSFHILDSSSVRHEIQCFIGTRLFRENGNAYFGVFFDSQRFASLETKYDPIYMKLNGGRLVHDEHYRPKPIES